MKIENFKDLIVWQKAMSLVEKIYKLTARLPKEEIFGLTSQMRRSAVSIPSNIAEGYERKATKEYLRFLAIANGSRAELMTQIEICKMLGLSNVDEEEILCDEVGKMLNTIIAKLESQLS